MRGILQEHDVHLVELELQNEELRRIRDELDTLRARYFNLYDLAPVGYATMDEHGLILEANVTLSTMLGVPRGTFVGQPMAQLIFEGDQDRFYLLRKHLCETGEPLHYELRMLRNDGSVLWADLTSVAAQDPEGSSVRRVVISDISTRKEAEEALLRAGALQRAIFNSANFSSIATDANGVIQIFNVGAEHMLGYSAAEVMNSITPADISDPKEVILRAKALSAELDTPIAPGFEALVFKASRGIEDIYELTYIRKDGSRFPAVVSVTALRDDQDAIIGYLLIGTDNTARKVIEAEQMILAQSLRDHQFYTRSLIESNIDALMTTDASGIITDVNKQLEMLTDCTRDELIGSPFKNYFTDPDMAGMSIQMVLSEKKLTNYELTVRSRDGKETGLSFNFTTFYNRDRKLQGVFAAARDITERKHTEKLRDLVEGIIQHDLRSPANNAINVAAILCKDTNITPVQRQLLTLMETAGKQMLDTLNRSLDLIKIESGQYQYVPQSIDCLHLTREVAESLLGMPQNKHAVLDVLVNGVLPETDASFPCMGHPDLLRAAIYNFTKNALEASPKGDAVHVNIVSDTDLRIEIRNKGVIPLDIRDRFLEKYATSGKTFGTGLGTYSAKMMIEAQGGSIEMQTSDEMNETFITVHIPTDSVLEC